jgi:hypothetical protein
MLAKPSRPAHFEYCPIFRVRTASCSTVLRGEALQRNPRRWRAFANDRIRPPGIPNLEHAVTSVFLISS